MYNTSNLEKISSDTQKEIPSIKDFDGFENLANNLKSTRIMEIIPEHISYKIGCYPSTFVFGEENVSVVELLKEFKNLGFKILLVNILGGREQSSYFLKLEKTDEHICFYVYISSIYIASSQSLSRLEIPKNMSIDLSNGISPLMASSITFYFNPEDKRILDLGIALSSNNCICLEDKPGDINIELITKDGAGFLTTKNIPLKSNKVDLAMNYGESFLDFDQNLIKKLSVTNKGIMMFHGDPGTGKTTYIRSLVPKLTKLNKRVLLIPKHIIGAMESPDFNEFMLNRFTGGQEIIFIVEDAESLITSKNPDGSDRSSLISTILNLSDGILNDIFHISIILTFNTKIINIDDALLRKGRLIAKYEFSKLMGKDFLPLAESLGVASKIKENVEYALSDIYALTDEVGEHLIITKKKDQKVMGL